MTGEVIDYSKMSDEQLRQGVSCYGFYWDANDTRCQIQCPIEERCSKRIIAVRIPEVHAMLGIQMDQNGFPIFAADGSPVPEEVIAGQLSMAKENLVQLRRRVATGVPVVSAEKKAEAQAEIAAEVEVEEAEQEPEMLEAGEVEQVETPADEPDVEAEADADGEMEEYMAQKKGTKKKTKKKTRARAPQAALEQVAPTAPEPAVPPPAPTIPRPQRAIVPPNGARKHFKLSPTLQAIADELAEFGVVFQDLGSDQDFLERLPSTLQSLRSYAQQIEAPIATTNEELVKENALLRGLLKSALQGKDKVELPLTEVLGLLRESL